MEDSQRNSRKKQEYIRLLAPCALILVLAATALPYLVEIHSYTFQSDDYLFLSQVTRYGLAKSLVIPFRDHFVPLYRFLMGGLYLLLPSAIPIGIAALGFHLISTSLIFFIVLNRTKSVTLSTAGAVTFGLSYQAMNCLLWSLSGYIVASLCFVLVMSLSFERFLDLSGSLYSQSGPLPTDSGSDSHSGTSALAYYYVGMALFVIALGFFTLAFVGGLLVWLFMYARLLRRKPFQQSLRYHIAIVLPFLAVTAAYLLLRSYFNNKYLPLQDYLFRDVQAMPSFSLREKADIVRTIPGGFYSCAVTNVLPYFGEHYLLVPGFLALLLAKEFLLRKREGYIGAFWLGFAFFTAAVPTFGRIFLGIKIARSLFFVIAPHYFYYSMAGISIALGLLLRPPPLLERSTDRRSSAMRIVLLAVIVALLVGLNRSKITGIRGTLRYRAEENLKFHRLVIQYRNAMTQFLRSPLYSPQEEFYVEDGAVGAWSEYRSSFSVRKYNIFYLYFPNVKNIHFLEPEQQTGAFLWTPQGVKENK